MTLTTKIISAVIGGTVVAGGAGGAIFLSTRGTLISDLLKKDNKKIITDDQDWKVAWGKYLGRDDNNKQNKWEIAGTLDKATVDPKFKTECQNRQNHRVSGKEDQNYKDFLEWCAKAQ